MPGPFPGMDPYLEAPSQWQGIHNTLTVDIAYALNALMPRGYAARVEDRCRVVQTQRGISPDVVLHQKQPLIPTLPIVGNVAVVPPPTLADIAAVDTPVVIEAIPVEPHDTYIDIISTTHGGRIVTTIELLSPVNKAPGEGQNLYLTKQREIMRSQTHLLEIDLLRVGSPTVASGRPALPDMPRYDYIICLHRGGHGERFEIWPTSIRQRLPRIFVPLMNSDPDIILDLQAVLDHFYDFARLADQINYALPPETTLIDENAVWADALLREKGLRS